ncbi:hypothetical protein CONPUDRAFT_94709 [Coniophora puteana RWD-64-598 SS2]|uniref:Uncharacterized protein n=1 Tax=Coniophora puteana (strain RWD-64-598) TaxID=741705 RepID=A0A5M3N4K3_CONPW|nr:uncharacterized protein CONPUDRAFT_94709 [Coniophora puteana RWD-64-598 SS2]EIW86352.1 hypothetical protein CONPUDRAFT_94709 [Coniophora puteana RWD-64-598 SS2]
MPNPSAGSANPAASLSSLWGYILPALNHIVRSPTNSTDKAPAIDISYHMGIHTATYNYFTTQSDSCNPRSPIPDKEIPSGTDLYEHIDRYYAGVARELLLGAPEEDSADLIHYLLPCFQRYAVGANSVNRLLNYVNRHYVKRAVDEDRGWLTLGDIFDAVSKNIEAGDTRQKIAQKLRERRTEELAKWGTIAGPPDHREQAERLASAETCAEAASSLDRVVPLYALALRRFRTEFMEPLLAVPKIKSKKKRGAGAAVQALPSTNGSGPPNLPKGRLSRAYKDLQDSEDIGPEEKRRLTGDLAQLLRAVGVRHGHPVRKRLDKYLINGPSSHPTT